MFCNNCGAEIINDSKFCNNCGNKISNEDKVILNKDNLSVNNTQPPNNIQPNYNYSENYYTQPTNYNQYQYNRSDDSLGGISLGLGIASIICLPFLGIAAIIIGIIKLNKKDGQDNGLCIGGIITGIIGVIILIFWIIIIVVACVDNSADTSYKHKDYTYSDNYSYDDDDYSYDDSSYDL